MYDDVQLLISEIRRDILAELSDRSEDYDIVSPFVLLPVHALVQAAGNVTRRKTSPSIFRCRRTVEEPTQSGRARSPEIIHGLGTIIQARLFARIGSKSIRNGIRNSSGCTYGMMVLVCSRAIRTARRALYILSQASTGHWVLEYLSSNLTATVGCYRFRNDPEAGQRDIVWRRDTSKFGMWSPQD